VSTSPIWYHTAAMKTKSTPSPSITIHHHPSPSITIGIDLGDSKHAICVLDGDGTVVRQDCIVNSRSSLWALSRRHPGALIVMEVGMHSPWTSCLFKGLGHRVLVANPRKVRLIYQNSRKSDRKDAEMLARIARTDVKLLYPVEHVCEEHRGAGWTGAERRAPKGCEPWGGEHQMQRDLLQIKLRDKLVRQRVDIISLRRICAGFWVRCRAASRRGRPGEPRGRGRRVMG
jgi:hypothetical protein